MRVRATRLGVTGCNARKRGINIAALFGAYPGRVGAYWGKSFADNLARNRQALSESAAITGWTPFPGGTVVASGNSVSGTTAAGSNVFATKTVAGLIPGQTYCVTISMKGLSSSSGIYIEWPAFQSLGLTASGGYVGVFVAQAASASFQVVGGGGSVQGQFSAITLHKLDWSKIVQFADPAGTVPWLSVFQAGAGLGLVLDQSKGLVRGPALTPDAAALNGGATVAGGWYTAGAGASVRFNYPLSQLVQGSAYEVFIEVSASTGTPSLSSDWCDGLPGTVSSPAAGGMYHFILPARPAGYDATYRFLDVVCGGSGSFTFRVASFCALPGNHLQQPTAAARGELSARYNQVPSSGNVTLWQQNGTFPITVTPGGSPSGGDVSTSSVITGTRYFQLTAAVGMSYRHVACVRPPNPNLQQRMYSDGVGGAQYIDIVPATGAFVASGGATGSAEALGGGWYRLTATYPAQVTAGMRAFHVYNLRNESVDWGDIDVRLVDDAIASLPAFQAVRSATDYDDVGFPIYWRTQTDDFAYTDVDPAGATKVNVFAAIQKMSEAATGMVLETSTDIDTSNGGFRMTAPGSAGANEVAWVSKGTNGAVAQTAGVTAYDTPARLVLHGYGDVVGDVSTLRINGAQAASVSTDQGAGPYGAHRLYVGSRAGTSAFENARWFALPMVMYHQSGDPGLTASQTAQIERQMAQAAGVTL